MVPFFITEGFLWKLCSHLFSLVVSLASLASFAVSLVSTPVFISFRHLASLVGCMYLLETIVVLR